MSALSAARHTWHERTRMGDTLRIPMAADAVIYQGGMVCVDADGYAVAAADTANYKFAGVACEDPQNPAVTYDNTGGSDGDVYVVVRCAGRFRFKYSSPEVGAAINQNMMMAEVYVQDDQTVSVHPWDSVNDVRCGHVCRLPAMTLALDPQADFDSDEIEIEMSGDPFVWDNSFSTTTTTAAQA